MWKINQRYGNFFNESKIDRIRHNIQKTGSQLFIQFRSNYISSFVNTRQKRKYPQKTLKKNWWKPFLSIQEIVRADYF